jgi:hypothetical protein
VLSGGELAKRQQYPVKVGDLVFTPDGIGEIKEIEDQGGRSERFGVALDKNIFDYPVAFYFKHELKKA